MDYEKEINRICEDLGMNIIYPCDDCPRKEEEFCSNRRCLETLQKLEESKWQKE